MSMRHLAAMLLLLLLVAGAAAQTQPEPAENVAEIVDLTVELAATGEALATAQARYDALPWSRDRTDDFVALARQVDGLRERLAELGRRIAALRAAAPAVTADATLTPVRATLNEYGGPPLPATVGEGAVLAFETDLQFPVSDSPQVATLQWQVLDAAGNALPGLAKREQVAETGGSKTNRFRFRIADIANGAYRVLFTYQPAVAGAEARHVEATFTMLQAVRIHRLVVAPDTVAAQHAAILYPEQVPHLFVYFSAADAPNVMVDFALLTGSGRSERYRQRVERVVKPGEAEQRVGIRLDPGLLRAGEGMMFSATVTGPDGATASREVGFRVEHHVARIQLANRLRSNEPANFHIELPAMFAAPLRVTLSPNNATASLSGETSGRLVPLLPAGSNTDGHGALAVTVTDAEGRLARGHATFTIAAPPPPPAQAPVVSQAPAGDWARVNDTNRPSYTPPPAAPAPAAPEGPSLSDALRDFQRQMAQIQADKQAAEQRSQQERQQQMQQLMSQLNRPAPQAAPQRSVPQPQSRMDEKAYWTVTTHTVIEGVCRSERTANTCQIVQSKSRPPTQCGQGQRCNLNRVYPPGGGGCNQWGAWKTVMDVIGPHSLKQAQEYCQRVKASPFGLVRSGGSCSHFCGVEKMN